MTEEFLDNIFKNINIFDTAISIIFFYFIVQCSLRGFSLSLISFTKWILSTVVTIILVPKLQPMVSDYVESDFVNSIGLGVTIFVFTLFSLILVGKGLGRAVTWTGVGSIDKTFGLFFGIFKGYIVCVCIFSILNWFYPYKNWGIQVEKAFTFNLIDKGSKILIDEFPSSEDFIDTKEKIEKI